jgi:hypothetical protein
MFAPFVVPRNLSPAIAFTALLAGSTLAAAFDRVRCHRIGVVALVLMALTTSSLAATQSWQLTGERSGFSLAARYVARHGADRGLVVNETMVFYLRASGESCTASTLRKSLRLLAAFDEGGDDYAIIDQNTTSITQDFMSRVHAVAQYPAALPIKIGEKPIASENGYPPTITLHTPYVDVFPVDKLPLPGDVRASVPSCNQARLA